VLERTIELVTTIRNARKTTPIFMVGHVTYQQGHLNKTRREKHTRCNENWRAMFDELQKKGVRNLYYIPGDDLFGDDDEATVDGTHATDLGFWRMAQVIAPHLQSVLEA
jgi:hypothetical protein